MSDELFTTRMKKATRKVHAVSDALVNAKLLLALDKNDVWTEGLLIFYEIFKFLEQAMVEKKNENLGKLYIEEMSRTSAFESDLNFYLGRNWKENYVIRDSVKNYLSHLQHLLNTDSDLLMAYVYHLYMGLLSGGQILAFKRKLQNKIVPSDEKLGEAVTDFKESISSLKTRLKSIMNEVADDLDENKKNLLVEESKKVFELNNSIIKTVQGTDRVVYRKLFTFASCTVLVLAIIYYFRFVINNKNVVKEENI